MEKTRKKKKEKATIVEKKKATTIESLAESVIAEILSYQVMWDLIIHVSSVNKHFAFILKSKSEAWSNILNFPHNCNKVNSKLSSFKQTYPNVKLTHTEMFASDESTLPLFEKWPMKSITFTVSRAVKPETWKSLEKLTTLTKLDIGRYNGPVENLAVLSDLNRLRYFGIGEISDQVLEYLQSSPLDSLSIRNFKCGDHTEKLIQKFSLTDVQLGNGDEKFISYLQDMPITRLHLAMTISPEAVGYLAKMPLLRLAFRNKARDLLGVQQKTLTRLDAKIDTAEIKLESQDVKALNLFPIEELRYESPKVCAVKPNFSGMPLHSLILWTIEDDDISDLGDIPLTKLDLCWNRRVTNKVFNHLTKFPLKTLVLEGSEMDKLDGVENLRSLTSLNIANTKVKDITPLGKVKTLTHLNITQCKDLTDWGKKVLVDMPQVTVVPKQDLAAIAAAVEPPPPPAATEKTDGKDKTEGKTEGKKE